MLAKLNKREREREREREQNNLQQQQLLTQITQLEFNPTKNQVELEAKRKKLQVLQDQEKTLTNSLPLDTQITILERKIKELENKSNKTLTEQTLLDSKKRELEELLKRQSNSNVNSGKPDDKTGLYIGCGVIGLLALLLIFILARNRQKRKLKK